MHGETATGPLSAIPRRYWSTCPLLITVEGPRGRTVSTLDKPFARIGSHESSEIVLPGGEIARRELYLHATAAGVFCVDLAGQDAARPRVRGWLSPEQWINLGAYRISARLDGEAGLSAAVDPDLGAVGHLAAPLPVVALFVNDQEIGRRPLLRRLTVVGRRRPSPIRLSSHWVSAPHCVLYWQSPALWVVDLLSSNGTWLDEQRIEAVELRLGGSVALGRVKLSYARLSSDRAIEERALPLPSVDISDEIAQLALKRQEFEEDRAAWQAEQRRCEAEYQERMVSFEQLQAELTGRAAQVDQKAGKLEEDYAQLDEKARQLEEDHAQLEKRASQFTEEMARLARQREQFEALHGEWASQRDHSAAEVVAEKQQFEQQRANTLEPEAAPVLDPPSPPDAAMDSNSKDDDKPRGAKLAEANIRPDALLQRLTDGLVRLDRGKRPDRRVRDIVWGLTLALLMLGALLTIWLWRPAAPDESNPANRLPGDTAQSAISH